MNIYVIWFIENGSNYYIYIYNKLASVIVLARQVYATTVGLIWIVAKHRHHQFLKVTKVLSTRYPISYVLGCQFFF
jgi:hypothetical protein